MSARRVVTSQTEVQSLHEEVAERYKLLRTNKTHLKDIYSKYGRHNKAVQGALDTSAVLLSAFDQYCAGLDGAEITKWVSEVASCMRYQEYHSARVLNELTNNVLAPIGTLLGAGLADAQSAKKTYDRAKKSLEDSIKRTIESPSSLTKRTKQAEIKAEHKKIEQEYNRLREEALNKLDKANSHCQFYLTECLTAYLEVHRTYYSEMNIYFQNIGDRIEEAKAFAAVRRAEYESRYPPESNASGQSNNATPSTPSAAIPTPSHSSGSNLTPLHEHGSSLVESDHTTEESPSTMSPPITRQAAMKRDRRELVQRVIDEQREYVAQLNSLARIQSALNRDVAMSTKVSIEDLDSIFRNTPALVKLHYDLLLKLEHINPHDHRAVIQLFADKLEQFTAYTEFFRTHTTAKSNLSKIRKASKTFAIFIRNAEVVAGGTPLQDLLDAPMQSLIELRHGLEALASELLEVELESYPQFKELLTLLKELTASASPISTLSQSSASSIGGSSIAPGDNSSSINNNSNSSNNFGPSPSTIVMQVQSQLTGYNDTLATANRILVKEGPLFIQAELKQSRDARVQKMPREEFYVFLFNDLLLYAVSSKGRLKKQYRYAGSCSLHSAIVDGESASRTGIRISVEANVYRLSAATSDERDQWLAAIQHECQILRQPKLFGVPLEILMQSPLEQNHLIPSIVDDCTTRICISGISGIGLFTSRPDNREIEALRESLDQGNSVDFTKHDYDQRVMAALLVHWLRELPEPLTTFELYEQFIACQTIGDIAKTVAQLPTVNLYTLQHLISFLVQVVSNSSSNKVTIEHVAIIFGPILFRQPHGNPFWCMTLPQTLGIVTAMLRNYPEIFGTIELERRTLESKLTVSLEDEATDSELATTRQMTALISPRQDSVAAPGALRAKHRQRSRSSPGSKSKTGGAQSKPNSGPMLKLAEALDYRRGSVVLRADSMLDHRAASDSPSRYATRQPRSLQLRGVRAR